MNRCFNVDRRLEIWLWEWMIDKDTCLSKFNLELFKYSLCSVLCIVLSPSMSSPSPIPPPNYTLLQSLPPNYTPSPLPISPFQFASLRELTRDLNALSGGGDSAPIYAFSLFQNFLCSIFKHVHKHVHNHVPLVFSPSSV